jgi:hypothetical protein
MKALDIFTLSHSILRKAGSARKGLPQAWEKCLRHIKPQEIPEYFHDDLAKLGALVTIVQGGNSQRGPTFVAGVSDIEVERLLYLHEALAHAVQRLELERLRGEAFIGFSPLATLVNPPQPTLTPHQQKLQAQNRSSWAPVVSPRDRRDMLERMEKQFPRLSVDVNE